MKKYKPLPDYLTIKKSGIEGLGLFATEDIENKTRIGITHYFLWEEVTRSPLGGFINHSNLPNCTLLRASNRNWLETTEDIKAGQELTLKYEMYKVEEK